MKKTLLYIATILAVIIGIVSVTKYINMSVCCQPSCESIVAIQTDCENIGAIALFHHLEMVDSISIATISPLLESSIVFPLFVALGIYSLYLYSSQISYQLFLGQRRRRKKLGYNMNPFDTLRLLRARGIIGDQKNFV